MISGDGVRHREEPEEHAAYRGALRAIIGGSAAARREAGRAVLGLVRGGTGYAENSMAVLARLGLMDETVDLARSLYLGKGSIALDRTRQFRSNSRFQQNGEADTDHLFHPLLAPLRRAGRFAEVFEGVGLAAYWRQAGGPDL
jgi:hypothetical protein